MSWKGRDYGGGGKVSIGGAGREGREAEGEVRKGDLEGTWYILV